MACAGNDGRLRVSEDPHQQPPTGADEVAGGICARGHHRQIKTSAQLSRASNETDGCRLSLGSVERRMEGVDHRVGQGIRLAIIDSNHGDAVLNRGCHRLSLSHEPNLLPAPHTNASCSPGPSSNELYLVILISVKTAISIPDEMFIRADAFARRLGLSRSELYTRALDAYLGPATDDAITAALDQVYGDEVSELDPVVRRAQIRAVGDTW
jgi:hypothetical protein